MSETAPDPTVETAPKRPAEAPAGSAPPPAPPGPVWKRALAAVFLHDLPLKALAAVLAVITWQLVREQVTTTAAVPGISIEVVGVPRDVAVVDLSVRQVTVSLLGTRGEVERARALLGAEPRVKVAFPDVPDGQDAGTTAPIQHPSDFTFPIENPDLVNRVDPGVAIEWVRLSERTVPVAAPEVVVKPGIEPAPGWPTLETSRVTVRGPKRVVDALTQVVPDPVDTAAWVARDPELLSQWTWTSGYGTWRETDPLRGSRFLTIDPDRATGKVKLRTVAAPRAVEHALRLVLPAEAPDLLSRFEVVVEGGPEYDRTTRRIRLSLKGEKKAIEELEANPDGWSYVVEVPGPTDSGESPGDVRVPVRLLLGSVGSAGKALGAGVSIDGAPVLTVSLRRRPGT